jgi:GNAT superfamily N-acetyltransferase
MECCALTDTHPQFTHTMPIITRPMILDDIPELAELYRQYWDEPSEIPKMKEHFQRLLKRDDYIFLSAVEETQLIGTVMGIVCESLYGDCRPYLLIEDLIVDQHHRRKGVASWLLAELENWARKKGCRQALLVSEASREDARCFYLARGFPADNIGFKKKFPISSTPSIQ